MFSLSLNFENIGFFYLPEFISDSLKRVMGYLANDLQSVHLSSVGLSSCVPTVMQSNEQ